jgi:phage shock protein C
VSGNERRSEWLVVLGIGLVLWGGWWLLNGFLAPLLWPLRAVLDAIARVGWPLALIAIGVLVIVAARRGGQVVIRGRRLYRSRENRMVGGVLAGAADYLGVDPTLLRLADAVLAVFTSFFPAFLLYIIAMAVIPEEPVTTVIHGHATVVDPAPAPPIPPTPPHAPAATGSGAPAEPPAPTAPSAPPAPPAPAPPVEVQATPDSPE